MALPANPNEAAVEGASARERVHRRAVLMALGALGFAVYVLWDTSSNDGTGWLHRIALGVLAVLAIGVCVGADGRRLASAGALAAGFLATPCFLTVVLLVVPPALERMSRVPFDAVAWREEGAVEAGSARSRMVDDLLSRYELVGMTRAEIELLLGPPDDAAHPVERTMVYRLGRAPGFGSGRERLLLRLDDAERVEEHRLLVD